MFIAGIKLLAAASLGLAHIGTDDNVRIEPLGSDVRITAYGAAAFVPLLVTRAELVACLDKLAGGDEAVCTFQQRGSIASRRVGNGHQVTFADPINANVVDIELDAAALANAIAVLRSA